MRHRERLRKALCPLCVGSLPSCICAQSCPPLWDPLDGNPPDSSANSSQARILEWVATIQGKLSCDWKLGFCPCFSHGPRVEDRPSGTWKRVGEINIKKKNYYCFQGWESVPLLTWRCGEKPLPVGLGISQCSVCPREPLCRHTPAQSLREPGQHEYSPLLVLLTQVMLFHALRLSF